MVVVAATALGRIGAVSLALFFLDQSRGGCGGRVEARTFSMLVCHTRYDYLLSVRRGACKVCWCPLPPSAANLTRTTVKMRQSIAAALILCTAAAFAPQQHSARTTIKLSSAKPTAGISFYDGLYEPDVPDVKLTRWRCSVHTHETPPADAVAAQVQGRRERRRDVQL